MTLYDMTTPRSRGHQRISDAEVLCRSFDHRGNALVTQTSSPTPFYANDAGDVQMSIAVAGGGANTVAKLSPTLFPEVSFYGKATAGAPTQVTVTIEALTQLGDYVQIYTGTVALLIETKVVTAYRSIRVTANNPTGGHEVTLYFGGL